MDVAFLHLLSSRMIECFKVYLSLSEVLTVIFYLAGISIIEDGGADGITMELEMQWDGNPSIVLDIKTRLGVALPVQVLCADCPFYYLLLF